MTPEHRSKIANSQILNRLIDHHLGKLELSKTQVDVGLALLKKVMPDLQAIQHSGDADNPIETITRVELVAKTED